jgi:hypothetical protein
MIRPDPRAVELHDRIGVLGFLLRSIEYGLTYTSPGRLLTHGPPPIVRAVGRTHEATVRRTIRLARRFGSHQFTDADPFALRWVDPERIGRVERESPQTVGVVVDGGWDRSLDRFDDRPIPVSIRTRLVDGADWTETLQFERLADERGPAVARRWARSIDDLADRIDREGYRTQDALFERDPRGTIESNTEAVSPRHNEIGVSLGREGELLWRHRGQHRLAIARALGIEAVPVLVLARHERWQAIRDHCRSSESVPSRFEDHPDLRDLRSTLR